MSALAYLLAAEGVLLVATTEAEDPGCAASWAQCGGKSHAAQPWTGPTECCNPTQVCVGSAWYKHCEKDPSITDSPVIRPTYPPSPRPTRAGGSCPPKRWEQKCGEWPPTSPGERCCSASGYLGASSSYCAVYGSIDSVREGCCREEGIFGWECEDHREEHHWRNLSKATKEPCTGEPAVDAVLQSANMAIVTKLHRSKIYTWRGFCAALRLDGIAGPLQLRGWPEATPAHVLVNIAGVLAHAMLESQSGNVPWSECDEEPWKADSSIPQECSQRWDNRLYHELADSKYSCAVDPQMTMTAVQGGMSCGPGRPTARCCWWGRGPIKTTGPGEFGELQHTVVRKSPGLAGVDLCKNPEAMCEPDSPPELKWIGAMRIWATRVQASIYFRQSLDAFVASNFSSQSVVGGNTFPGGTGSVLKGALWRITPTSADALLKRFALVMTALETAGLRQNMTWEVNGIIQRKPTTTTSTEPPTTAAPTVCPPVEWDRCNPGGVILWPPPDPTHRCCSTSGFFGEEAEHCDESRGGIDLLKLGCCNDGGGSGVWRCKTGELVGDNAVWDDDDKNGTDPIPDFWGKGWIIPAAVIIVVLVLLAVAASSSRQVRAAQSDLRQAPCLDPLDMNEVRAEHSLLSYTSYEPAPVVGLE